MNRQTIEKLKNNPHYIMSAEQEKEAEEEREPMVEIGRLPIHNTSVPIHPTLKKRTR